jgi:hypothetical protein
MLSYPFLVLGRSVIRSKIYQLSTKASLQVVGALANRRLHEFLPYSSCTECTLLSSNPQCPFSSSANSISSGSVLRSAFVPGVPLAAYHEVVYVVGVSPSSLLGVHRNGHNNTVLHHSSTPARLVGCES